MYNKNTITLNGKISTQIPGLLIQELPPISKPLLRAEKEEIDGRDGDIITPLGYSSYNKEITIGLYGNYDIDEVISYFNGEGTVIFSNEPDKYYNYQILEQIDFERLVRYKTATVTFHVQPFKYAAFEGDFILDPPADNFISIPDNTLTSNGVTVSVADGIVTIQGTPTAATEFYLPITALALTAGTYQLSATSSGTNPNYCSIRLIGSAPSDADSLGGKYITLAEGTVTLQGTLSASKTFNYLWFYMNPGQTFNFTATFEVENQAQKTASGEGTEIALINTSEAPFSRFDLKGNTYQQTYSGKNLASLETSATKIIGGVSFTTDDAQINITGVIPSGYNSFYFDNFRTQSGSATLWVEVTGYTDMASGTGDNAAIALQQSDNGTSGWTTVTNGNIALSSATSKTRAITLDSSKYYRVRFYAATGNTFTNATIKIQLEYGENKTSFEPYVGGIPAPNPDYPQEIYTVKHQDMIRLTGKNLVNANELYLPSGITRTTDGFQKIITSSNLSSYYSGSVANPIGVYTISFDARIANADEATLVLNTTAYIWGQGGLTLKNDSGEAADENYRTLKSDWKRYNFTVVANASEVWTPARAMYLYFATFTNSPIFELRNFQIEAGMNATEYDISQTQMYPINFRTGKNMLSEDFLIIGGLSSGNPQPTVKYRVHNSLAPIKVMPNTTYSLSVELGETVKGMRAQIHECDGNTQYLRGSGTWRQLVNGYTFTTGDNTQYLKLLFSLSTTDASVSNSNEDTTEYDLPTAWLRGAAIQLEAGDTVTTFEPYESMELCKIGDYQDYLSKSGDDWYLHKAISKAELGTLNWNASATNQTGIYRMQSTGLDGLFVPPSTISVAVTGLSSHFIAIPANSTGTYGANEGLSASPVGNTIHVYNKNYNTSSSASALKTWLANNNVVFYYPLVTATDTQITNEETIAQLNYLNSNVHAYKEMTFISSLPGGATVLPPIIAAEVPASSDGVVTNAGNFPAKPKLTIYGVGDIGVSLNGIQIFQISLGDNDHVTIDTAAMEAYQDSTDNLMNRLVVGDYDTFTLNPGENSITFSGVVTKCIVENYSRWL